MYECHSFHLTAGQASGSLQALNVKQMLHVSFTVNMEHKVILLSSVPGAREMENLI